MKKKGLSILLSVCMLLMMLPFSLTASAAEQANPEIFVMNRDGTNSLNVKNAAPEELPEGLSYDDQTNTLTLDNVVITEYVSSRTEAAIITTGSSNLTIHLKGRNVIKVSDECYSGIFALDGDASQQMVITGDGSLVIDGPNRASIRTQGSIVIDSSVSLLAGFGCTHDAYRIFKAEGGITIGGKPYTVSDLPTEGAVVNGKVIDKVRKTQLDMTADSVSYGTEGTFNPKTQSVTVEETGEGWGWNHETKTFTMSGTVIYNPTLTLPDGDLSNKKSALDFGMTGGSSATIELTEGTANAVIMGEIVGDNRVINVDGISAHTLDIVGRGSLTSVGGMNDEYESSRGYGIHAHNLTISDSVTITGIGGLVKSQSFGIIGSGFLMISGSAKVLALGGRGTSSYGMCQHAGSANCIRISDDAQVEARGDTRGINSNFGNVEINGGTVKAVGGEYGVLASQNLIVTGGSLTAIGGKAALSTYQDGIFTVAPASKQLGVYAGDAAPGTKLALVTAPETLALTSEQAANKYIRIAYEPALGKDADVKAQYIPGGNMETVYSVDVSWGAMEFTYSPGNGGVWNPETHQVEGAVVAGWQHKDGANQVRVVNHSNTAVDVKFAFAADPGFEAVIGAFDKPNEVLANAMNTDPNAAPSVTSALTLSGELSDQAASMTKIGSITVSIDAAK